MFSHESPFPNIYVKLFPPVERTRSVYRFMYHLSIQKIGHQNIERLLYTTLSSPDSQTLVSISLHTYLFLKIFTFILS